MNGVESPIQGMKKLAKTSLRVFLIYGVLITSFSAFVAAKDCIDFVTV
jgi:hypothetical protein